MIIIKLTVGNNLISIFLQKFKIKRKMKIKILLIGLFAVFTSQVISQEKGFRFGIKVAPNTAWDST